MVISEQFDKSIEVAKLGLKHIPDEPQLHFSLANVYGKMAKYPESEKYFNNAIKLAPNNAKFHANKGRSISYTVWNFYCLESNDQEHIVFGLPFCMYV